MTQPKGVMPIAFSSENIFTPITSAIMALVIKKPPNNKYSFVALSLMIVGIIGVEYEN